MDDVDVEPGPSTEGGSCPKRKLSECSDDSAPEESEFELYTKYFSTIQSKVKTKIAPLTTSDTNVKQPVRKRKFVYKTDEDVVSKKLRKFYFINPSMTKPRRPRRGFIMEPKNIEVKVAEPKSVSKTNKGHFVKADEESGHLCLMHRNFLNADLFYDDEKKDNYEVSKKQDVSWNIVDEIALEGLDGITIEAFWKRLQVIFPNFYSKAICERIWRLICNNKRLNFYILNKPRDKLIIFNREDYTDPESSTYCEPPFTINDIYPIVPVTNKEIRGSCSTYDSRKENNGVRKFSLEKALKLYDQKLVLVADQATRNQAIISEETDPNMELFDVEYAILERIGRSRYEGEMTQGKMSLVTAYKNLKYPHYHIKSLNQNLLLVNQVYYYRPHAANQTYNSGLIHLSRFYNKRRLKHVMLMEQIAQFLREKPNFSYEVDEFRDIFSKYYSRQQLVKLFKLTDFKRFFKVYVMNYRKAYPNARESEYLTKCKKKEKIVKILQIIDPTINITAALMSKDLRETTSQVESSTVDTPGHKFMNYDYLHEIYGYILSKGREGVTLQEINDYFRMDYYSVRMAVRKLSLRNIIDGHKIDLGRQQSLKFYAKCLTIPSLQINTEPKRLKLDPEVKSKILQVYNKKLATNPILYEPEEINQDDVESLPNTAEDTLQFQRFSCPIFLTEILADPLLEERTIMEIVLMGRDRLLLAGSNLEVAYESEFKQFLLKRDNFSKLVQLFRSGYGNMIYEILAKIRLSDSIKADQKIIFRADKLTPKFFKPIHVEVSTKMLYFKNNVKSSYSDSNFRDVLAKAYLFCAMFNQNHPPDQTINKLSEIFEKFMELSGKKRRIQPVKLQPQVETSSQQVSVTSLMPKFMGPNPQLVYGDDSNEGIKIEIFESTEPKRIMLDQVYVTDDNNVTQRYIDRANMILQCVNERTIVQTVVTLLRDIRKKENNEGYDKTVCKKSINTILARLVEEGYLKIIIVAVSDKNMNRSETFICLPHIDINHPLIRSTMDQLRSKFSQNQKPRVGEIPVKKQPSPFQIRKVKDSITELKQLTSDKSVPYNLNSKAGRNYGHCPKFARTRVLHEFMFYVIRDLNWDRAQIESEKIADLCESAKIDMTLDEIENLPPIYNDEIGWKMFIPPLPSTKNYWPKGWALACDLTLRMPLSIFVKLSNVSFHIPELKDYLDDKIKAHILVKHLPASIRNAFFYKRRYFFAIHETMQYLCFFGLLQFGPRNLKEKDHIFIYLNTKATLYDTCISKPGYNQIEDRKYKRLNFVFKTSKDVQDYWNELYRVSMHTQLGRRKDVDGHCIILEDCMSKPVLVKTLEAKTFEGAVQEDNGNIPGDHRGVAGLDSSIWTFLKRNWSWISQVSICQHPQIQDITELERKKAPKTPIQIDMVTQKHHKPISKKSIKSMVKMKSEQQKKIKMRIIKSAYRKRVREYYDAVDRKIMANLQHSRVEWNEEEDHLLRFCRAASVFLCPLSRKQVVSYNIIRDVIHRIRPASKNKTARAIQRRIYILLGNDELIRIMETNVENLLNSNTIAKYFEQIHNRYKNNIRIGENHINIAYTYLMSYIFKHKKEIELLLLGHIATVDFFSDPYKPLFELVLQNADEEIIPPLYSNPKTKEDIVKDTIKSVVHCSMCCRKNSPGWVFQLFHIYNKYPDELIRVTVSDMKKSQLLVINKEVQANIISESWHIPLKLSHIYNMLLKSITYNIGVFTFSFKKFLSLLSEDLSLNSDVGSFLTINELSSFWGKTSITFEIPERGVILDPDIQDHSEVIEELSKRFLIYLKKIFEGTRDSSSKKDAVMLLSEKPSSSDKASDSNKTLEQMKTDVKRLIFSVPYLYDTIEEYYKKFLDSAAIEEAAVYINSMIVDLKKHALDEISESNSDLKSFIETVGNYLIEDYENLLENLSKIVFAIQQLNIVYIKSDHSSTQASYEEKFKTWEYKILCETYCDSEETDKNYKLKKSKLAVNNNSGMEKCFKRAKQGDIPSLDEIKMGIMSNESGDERQFPHITDLIMLLTEGRFPELDSDYETIDKLKEHFIIQYPKLEKFEVEDLDDFVNTEVVTHLKDFTKSGNIKEKIIKATIRKPPELDKIQEYFELEEIEANIVIFIDSVIDYIHSKKEFGATAKELKTEFGNNTNIDLAKLLQFLCNNYIILRTGVNHLIFVHYEFDDVWLTETCLLLPEEEAIFKSSEKNEMKKLKSLIGERLKNADPYRVQLKPWTKLDGSLNDEVFNEWLCIILSHCLDFPCITFTALAQHFSFIKPVDIFTLLEALQDLSCVEISVINTPDGDIFSQRCVFSEGLANCLDDFSQIYIRTCNISGLRFGSYLASEDIFDMI